MRSWILVVDAAPFIADYLRCALESEEYEVETASSTVSAMLQMERREFSLALVALGLPDGDGLHLLRLLKSKDPSLEVIIMTGDTFNSIDKAVEATKQGASYFLLKPFDTSEMLTLVGKALEHRRLVAETSAPAPTEAAGSLEEKAAHIKYVLTHEGQFTDAEIAGIVQRFIEAAGSPISDP